MESLKPFANLRPVESQPGLEERINHRIAVIQKHRFCMRVSAFCMLALGSLGGFISSCAYVWNVSTSSGLSQFVAFIFSDSATALAYSKELGFSILESLPAIGIALVLTAGLALAWSLTEIIKQNQSYA